MILFQRKNRLLLLLIFAGFIQKVQAQKETFFHHFNWNQEYYTSAGSGAEGYSLNSLYRNFNDSTNHYLSLGIPLNNFNSALGLYYLHNTSAETQQIHTGISYTGFIRLGDESSLRLGIQGNRHQHAFSPNTWAFREYRTDTIHYSADASAFLQRRELSLGFAVQNLFPAKLRHARNYSILIGFRELNTRHWLKSSPYMLARIRHDQRLPEWRFKYTATIANFLMLGGTYFKNSDYLYGLHAGLKLFNTVWLTAATDFVDTRLPYRAIYEFGLRIHIRKKENRLTELPAEPEHKPEPKPEPEPKVFEGF